MEKSKKNIVKNFFQKIGKFFANLFRKIRGFFHRLNDKIRHHKLFTLVMMQLKDKWNLSFKSDKKGGIFKLSGYVLVFVAITAFTYLIMNAAGNKLGIFIGNRVPLNAMIPLLGVLIIFETVSIFIGMTRALFFAKDNVVLITYPVKSDYLFISKLIVYYIDALKRSLTLFFPVLISFGIIYGYSAYFYFWILLLDLVFIAVLVLVCGLFSIPGYYILRFLDRFKIIKIFFSFVIVGALIYGTILLIGVIPSNINLIREYDKFSRGLNEALVWIESNLVFFGAITKMFVGVRAGLRVVPMSTFSWAGFLIMIAGIAVLVVANIYLSKPFYHKMIANSNRSSNSTKKAHKNHRHNKYYSVLRYELIRIVRNEKYIAASLICVVLMPLFTLVVNKIYGSFDTRAFGDALVYFFNFFFIFLVAASHNISSSFIYSKDGPSWTVNKTMPINPRVSLLFRLVYNFVISLLIIIPSSILFFNRYKSDAYSIVYFILALVAFATFHSIASASFDYSHSKNKDKADIGSEIISSHETFSLAFAFLIALGFMLFFVIFALTGTRGLDFRMFLVSIFVLGLEIYFFLRKIRLTYQEN